MVFRFQEFKDGFCKAKRSLDSQQSFSYKVFGPFFAQSFPLPINVKLKTEAF